MRAATPGGPGARGRSLTARMKGAAALSAATYEEVEHDRGATGQAAAVVGMAAVAQAVGSSGLGLTGIVAGLLGAFAAWLLWAGVTYLIGDKLFGGTATWGELLRTLGFAQTPALLLVVAWIPLVGWIVRAIVAIWVLIAGFIALRQALDFGFGKTLLTVVSGWVVVALLNALLGVGM